MRAGVAKVCLTPPVGTWQGGYGARTRPSEGIHDDLYARALFLREDGDSPPVAVVSVDIVGLTHEVADAARRRAEELCGIPAGNVILCTSHTHGGPILRSFLGRSGPQPDPEYAAILAKYIAGAVAAASRDVQPATLRLGHAEGTLGVNRRLPTPEGLLMRPNPQGAVDRDVLALRVDRIAGTEGDSSGGPGSAAAPLAVLFRYACHATSMGAGNYLLTADYPGAAAAHVEAAYGGATVALFLQGCAGNVRPQFTSEQGGFRSATWEELAETGRQLGEATLAAAERAAPVTPDGAPVRIAGTTITLPLALPQAPAPLRRLLEEGKWETGVALTETERQWATRAIELVETDKVPEGVPAEVQVLRIGDAWLVTFPGEVFIEIGWAARDAVAQAAGVPPEQVSVAAYANGSVGYVPTAAAIPEGGYETIAYRHQGRPSGYVPEAGDLLVRAARDLASRLAS